MNVSRAPGAPCGSVFGCFLVLSWVLLNSRVKDKGSKNEILKLKELPNERLEGSWGTLWLGIRRYPIIQVTEEISQVKKWPAAGHEQSSFRHHQNACSRPRYPQFQCCRSKLTSHLRNFCAPNVPRPSRFSKPPTLQL